MNIGDLRRILEAFADEHGDVDLSRGTLTAQIRDELIDARVEESAGMLHIEEDGDRMRAFDWVAKRVARMQLLAERIGTHVPKEKYFIPPSGSFLDLVGNDSRNQETTVPDASTTLLAALRRTPGTTTVHYVTSDAGEGKTTLINEMARAQAANYRRKKTSWLLVPISLGGRSFLTFDDIVIAELVNKLRFPFFYYDAFLELVRLGIIVPAFDGFEEVFIEKSSGEAISALGNLIRDLKSAGSVLVAARRAYFEYQSFATQSKLFDAIRDASVDSSRLSLNRWSEQQFLDYAEKRGLSDGQTVHGRVRAKLGADHPLLTRAVLVRQLVEMWEQGDVDALLERLSGDPDDYFFNFVNAIVAREAEQKWIDRSGTPHQPLLTVDEHHLLLARLAREMWMTSTDALSRDYLNLIVELFAEDMDKPPHVAQQMERRLPQHSLIVRSGVRRRYSFDHEDFRRFYLGEAIAETLAESENKKADLAAFLSEGILSVFAANAAVNACKRLGVDLSLVVRLLQELVRSASSTSYVSENAGALGIRLAELLGQESAVELSRFVFPADALKGRVLDRVTFRQCQFNNTSLEGARVRRCSFIDCRINELKLGNDFVATDSVVEECRIASVIHANGSGGSFDPGQIRRILENAGLRFRSTSVRPAKVVTPNGDTRLAEQALRAFMRSTCISEDVFRQRFGSRASIFLNSVLPRMLKAGVLSEVDLKGPGQRKGYRLRVSMRDIQPAVPASVQRLDDFLASIVGNDDPPEH